MTTIKPLEEKNSSLSIYRILFLISLIVTGIFLDKTFLKQKAEIPSVLGKTNEIKLPTQEKVIKSIENNDLIKSSIQKAEDFGGVVLGEATSTVNKLASDAGAIVSKTIYENTIGKIVDQVDKLPADQQEKIREQICK